MHEGNRVILKAVADMLGRGDVARGVTTLSNLHAADAAEILERLDIDDKVALLTNMEAHTAARALLEMDESQQVEVASRLKGGRLYELLQSMPVDEAVDLLGDVPDDKRDQLLALFEKKEAVELTDLLAYGDDKAGGLMTPDFVSIPPDLTAEEVIERLRSVDPQVETIYYVYVTGEDGVLLGVLSLRQLIVSPPDRKVEEMMSTDILTVSPEADQEEVAEIISKYDLLAVPVTDGLGRMLGIVTVDDVMDVIAGEAEEDMMRFAGAADPAEQLPAGLWVNLGRRLPWFVVVVVVELLVAGGILKIYSPVLEEFLVLIFFIPLMVTMGGNIAIQSSTIMGHFMATGEPMRRDTAKTLLGEILWGLLFGALAGGVVGGLSYFLRLGPSVGLVVGLSLTLTILAASLVGGAIPVVLKVLHRDPAAAVSGPLLGTLMDVLSLVIYLAIGNVLI